MSFSFSVLRAREAVDYLDDVKDGIEDQAKKVVYRAAIALQKHVREHASGKTLGKGQGAGLWGGVHTARGNLARSWQVGAARIVRGDPEVPVGSSHPGAAIHEYGGTVRPVRARALTIPINPIADRKTARDFPPDQTALVKTPRGTFIVLNRPGRKSKKGEERGATTVFLYLLKRQVKMPARHYVTNALRDAQPEMDAEFFRGIDAAIKPRGGA